MERRQPNDGGRASGSRPEGQRRLLTIATLLSLILLGILIWVFLIKDDDESEGGNTAASVVSVTELRDSATAAGHPVYWAGERPGSELELTETEDGSFYVRYLSGGAEPGDERPIFLTVGTYPVPDAIGAVRRSAREAQVDPKKLPDGGLAFVPPTNTSSVYVAYPGSDYQIEIYHPDPATALDIARTDLAPVR